MKYNYEKSVNVTVPIPENYHDCIILLQSDYYRSHGCKAGVWRMYLYALYEPSFMFLFWHRLSQVKGWLWLYAKWRHSRLMFKYGLLIASSTKIGYGFFIGHPQGVVINHTAVIGNNVNISQFLTIGSMRLVRPSLAIMFMLVHMCAWLRMCILEVMRLLGQALSLRRM